MNKCLLALCASLLVGASSVSAKNGVEKAPFSVNSVTQEALQSRGATADGYELNFHGDIYTWYALVNKSNVEYTCYIEITPEVATSLAGNALTDITFCACVQSATTLPGTIFVSENVKEDPVVSKTINVANGYKQSYAQMQTESFDEPYIIKEGVGFCFGYTVKNCKYQYDYPVGVDNGPASQFAGKAFVKNSTGTILAEENFEDYDINLVVSANTVGEKKGLDNVFAVSGAALGNFYLPVINCAQGSIPAYVFINNLGSNSITSVAYNYSINGGDVVEGSVETNINPESEDIATLTIEGLTPGYSNVTLNLTAVNGQDVDITTSMNFIGINNDGYERKFVVEEGTSTLCGYCPAGIVGMEYMAANHPDRFIGIAIHNNFQGTTDPFIVADYQVLCERYFSGNPACIINRDPFYNISPSADYLEYCFGLWEEEPAAAKVDLKVTKSEGTAFTIGNLNVETTTQFALNDPNADYALAFVVIEDGLKATQKNYYSGGSYGEMGGWEKKGSTVVWTFSDIARSIYDLDGLNGSIPAAVEEGVDYSYTFEVPSTNIKNLEKTSVIALLIDRRSSTIINAAKVPYADYADPAGIQSVVEDNNAPMEYYNIQGMRVNSDNAPAGLYIIKQGDKITKSVIR